MKKILNRALIVLLAVAPVMGHAQVPWYVSYEKALTAQEQGDWKGSVTYLKGALSDKDLEKLKTKTYGLHFINYLPYFHLGLAYYNLNEKQKALENFDRSLSYGEVQEAPEEYARLQTLRSELAGEQKKPLAEVEKKAGEPLAAAPAAAALPSVSVPGAMESSGGLPWYVNYETGLAYIESGDWLNAIENLKLAIAANGIPRRYARTYGMWFITYIPYYYLGLAYYNQGLWQFAINYFETSKELGEVKDLEPESSKLKTFLEESRKKSTLTRSSPGSEELKNRLNTEIAEAIRLFNLQDYPKAESKFEAVLQLDPYNSVAKSFLLKISRQSKAAPKEAALPNNFSAGVLQLLKGRHEQAIKLLKSAEPDMGQDADLHAYLGVAYYKRYRAAGKKDKTALQNSRDEFRRALALDPSYELDPTLFSRDVIDVFQGERKRD